MYCELDIHTKDKEVLKASKKILSQPESKDDVLRELSRIGVQIEDIDFDGIEFWNDDQFSFNGSETSAGRASFSYELSSAADCYNLTVFCQKLSRTVDGIVSLSFMYEVPIDRTVFEYKNGEGELYNEPADYSDCEREIDDHVASVLCGLKVFFGVSEDDLDEYGGREFIEELVSETGATVVGGDAIADILVVDEINGDVKKQQYLIDDFIKDFINKLMFNKE